MDTSWKPDGTKKISQIHRDEWTGLRHWRTRNTVSGASEISDIYRFSFTEIYDLGEDGDLQQIFYSDSSLSNYQKFPEFFIVDPDFCSTARRNKLN